MCKFDKWERKIPRWLTFNRAPPTGDTEETYKKVLAENEFPVDVEKFDGYSLGWIGPRTAKAVILYMHGEME